MEKLQSIAFGGAAPDTGLLAHDEKLMEPAYERNLRSWLPASSGAAILDFGCGYGTFLRYLGRKGFSRLEGFDPDPRCSAFAGDHAPAVVKGGDPWQFLEGKGQEYDFISCLSVAEYFERPELPGWFSALRESLRPGGRLVLTVPNSAGLTGLTDYIQDPFIRAHFTDVALEDLCRLSGLEIEYLGGFATPRKGPKRALWQAARQVWFTALRLIYLLERGASPRNPRSFESMLLLVARRR